MTIIEQIKAEIERRITDNTFGAKLELIDILAWLDTLESEKPIDGLEEEIERYLHSLGVGYGGWIDGMDDDDLRGIARHFAQWGAEHLASVGKTLEIKPGDEVTINGHKIVYDKDKGYVTIVKSEESVPKDLEEAAWDCVLDSVDVNNPVLLPKYKELLTYLFIAGAKWQKQHDAELIEIAYNDGITIGMTKQNEQMMKEAVEATLDNTAYPTRLWFNTYLSEYSNNDRVRVIIVKEDKK